MPKIPITIQPGIDAQSTPALGATGWNESRNIRFFQGLAQKAGGFQKFCQAVISPLDPKLGRSAVELRAWAALSGIRNLAIGGENRVSLFSSDVVSDITPKTQASLVPMPALSTVSGSPTVIINDPTTTPVAGDWIRVRAPASVAGIVLDGPYEVRAAGALTLSATVALPQAGLGSYAPNDVLTATGGVGTEPTFTVTHTQAMGVINGGTEPVVNSPGSGGTGGLTTFTSSGGTGTPFTFTGTIFHYVTTGATVLSGGAGGTPGPVTVTVVGGTGTAAKFSGTISAFGTLLPGLTLVDPGDYTVSPGSGAVAITGGSLAAATVQLSFVPGGGSLIGHSLTLAAITADVLSGGAGGTPGPVTVVVVGGAGTPAQFSGAISAFGTLLPGLTLVNPGDYSVSPGSGAVSVSGGGLVAATVQLSFAPTVGPQITQPLTLVTPGDFTVNPTIAATPFTGGGLIGGTVAVKMGVLTITLLDAGLRTLPTGAVATTVDPIGGTGATLALVMGPATKYSVTAAVKANATVNDGGAVRVFSTTSGSKTVSVALNDHGLFSGEVDRITDPVLVGGITVEGNYIVTVIDPNTYTIEVRTAATSTANASENGGSLAVVYFNPVVGTQVTLEVESIDLDNWGEFLVIIPEQGPVFVWKPADGPVPAENVLTAPQANTSGFVSTQQQILVLCGTVNLADGLFDPLLVRWSDAGDYTQFVPLISNQAGSFRLQLGSAIIAGLAVAGRGLVWTDLGLYVMQYEGLPLIWGFQPIGVNCGLIGPKAMGVVGETVVWMSTQQFYVLAGGGSPQPIPCEVWDLVFKNIDLANARQSVCTTNAYFSEVAWYVPQLDGTVTKARLQIASGKWDYTIIEAGSTSNRSAGIDQNVFGPPIGASPEGVVYREETGTDADDEPLPWRLVTGIAQIAQGDQVAFFSEIIPDIKFSNDQFAGTGTVKMLVYVYRNPQAAPRVKGPYLINARTRSIPCRGRGRGLQFEFSGDDMGSSPRLGLLSWRGQPDGKGG